MKMVDIKQYVKDMEKLVGGPIENPTEFFEGQKDCKKGEFKPGMGECYGRGYACEYHMTEIRSRRET